jgi:hypothetical protein
MIDMKHIEWINRRYKFKIKQIDDWTVYIYDGIGEWLIEIESPPDMKHKNIILKHKNYKRNKDGWHVQSKYYDYVWAMGAIHNHSLKPFRKNNYLFRMKKIFEKIAR